MKTISISVDEVIFRMIEVKAKSLGFDISGYICHLFGNGVATPVEISIAEE